MILYVLIVAASEMNMVLDWAGWTTAIGTIALVAATAVLAWLTWLLAKASARPSPILTMETNRWAFHYIDMKLTNEGNASAFDVELHLDPELPEKFDNLIVGKIRNVSVLGAGQIITTNLGSKNIVIDKKYVVRISWRRRPGSKKESIEYELDMSFLNGISRLGGGDPLSVIAQEVKKIGERIKK
jgi:hypothetical protein